MRVSAKELYGLRAMTELARHFDQGPVSLAEVSRSQGISLDYLEQVAASLRKAGLLESRRGAQGGYLLSLYSLGLAIPFFIAALLVGRLLHLMQKYGWIMKYSSYVIGGLLVVIGFLLATGYYTRLSAWLLSL